MPWPEKISLVAGIRTARQMAPALLQSGFSMEQAMDARHVGSAVAYMASLPLEANVPFLTVMATTMPFIGRG